MFVRELSSGQKEAFRRAVLRRNLPLPSQTTDVLSWLEDSKDIVFVAHLMEESVRSAGPNAPLLTDLPVRESILGAMLSYDCFTAPRMAGINTLLQTVDDFPTLLTDRKKFRLTIREMNRSHQKSFLESFDRVDRAFELYNDNVGMGRPAVQCLETLVKQLTDIRVFSCFSDPRPRSQLLKEAFQKAYKICDTARQGKLHPDDVVVAASGELERRVRSICEEEASYWYNEEMIRCYFRDVIIPLTILNGYIDPISTTDFYGAIWNFLKNFSTDKRTVVSRSLLVHPSIVLGPRFIGIKELEDELKSRDIAIREFPYLETRLETKLAQRPAPTTTTSHLIPYSRPIVRLSRTLDFIPYLFNFLGEPYASYSDVLTRWIPTSIFGVDPAYGIAGRALNEILESIIPEAAKRGKAFVTEQVAEATTEVFHSNFQERIETVVGILASPFLAYQENNLAPIDPFEVRDALVNSMIAGLYQPRSDWEEEQEIVRLFRVAVKMCHRYDSDADTPIHKVELISAMEQLVSAIEPLYNRGMSITIDRESLEFWYILCMHTVAKLNYAPPSVIIEPERKSGLFLPLNVFAYRDALSVEAKKLLVDICERISSKMSDVA